MNKIISTLSVLALIFCLVNPGRANLQFSNNHSGKTIDASPKEDTAWVLQTEQSGVKCYYRVSTCGVFPTVLLRFENSNQTDMELSWEGTLTIDGKPDAVSASDSASVLLVKPGNVQADDCSAQPVLIVRNPSYSVEEIIKGFTFSKLKTQAK